MVGLVYKDFFQQQVACYHRINFQQYTVKPALAVTSIKQSPVLKGHGLLILPKKISYELNLF
jgi:hypothetical protein